MDIHYLTTKYPPEAVLLTEDNLKEVADSKWSAGKINEAGDDLKLHVRDITFPHLVPAYPGQYIVKTAPNMFSVHEPESLNYFYKGTTL